jgi:hypothetical protein
VFFFLSLEEWCFLFLDLVFCSFRGLVSNNAISSYQLYISWREIDKVQQLFKKARGDGGREGWEKVPVTSHARISFVAVWDPL